MMTFTEEGVEHCLYAFGTVDASGNLNVAAKDISVCALTASGDILFAERGSSSICCIPYDDSLTNPGTEGTPVLAFACVKGISHVQLDPIEWQCQCSG